MQKSLLLLAVMILGAIFSQASAFAFLVPYLLMFTLFFSFLDEKLSKKIFFQKRVYVLLFANIIIFN
jgi:hypothetical protein